jgi:hypothetical protein
MVVRHAIGCRHRRRSSGQPRARWCRTRFGFCLFGQSARKGSVAADRLGIRRSLKSSLGSAPSRYLDPVALDASGPMLRNAAHSLPEPSSPPRYRMKPKSALLRREGSDLAGNPNGSSEFRRPDRPAGLIAGFERRCVTTHWKRRHRMLDRSVPKEVRWNKNHCGNQ